MTWICKDRKKKKNTRLHVDVLSRLLVAPGGSIKGAICHVRCKIKNSSVWCLQSWLDSGLHLRRYTKFRTQIMLFFSVTFLETVSQQTKGCLEPLLFFLSLSLSCFLLYRLHVYALHNSFLWMNNTSKAGPASKATLSPVTKRLKRINAAVASGT